jgi:hypothetical protein
MKKAASLLLFAMLFSACQKEDNAVCEEMASGKYTLDRKIGDSLIAQWNTALNQDSIKATISQLKIIKQKDLNTYRDYYGILGTTGNDSAKVMTEVVLQNGKFYFPKKEVTDMVICFGSGNCNPGMSDGKWICDDGTRTPSCSKDCQKTIVSSVNN